MSLRTQVTKKWTDHYVLESFGVLLSIDFSSKIELCSTKGDTDWLRITLSDR